MTSKVVLLPAVNRNRNQVGDHNGFGLFAYGSRGCIYVLDLKSSLPVIVDSNVIRNAHRGKVLCISFCKSNSNQLLASVGEEMILKIWNLETATCITSLEVKEFSHVVEWLYDTTNLVVFSEASGTVSKWNFNTNNLVKMKTGSDKMITAMSSNKKCPELLAVGHTVGTICILNVNNQTCMKRLKAHSMEINSLSWSPISPSTLLSTSLDQSARVWNIDDDKPIHTYYYPSTRYKDKTDDKKNFKVCSILHPENPNVIICSNVRGALGSVKFSENAPPWFTPYSTQDFDNNFKGIFQMMPFVDVTGQNKHILLTCDPVKIALWNISDEKLLSSFNFVLGNIFDLSVSPINQNLLAVGPGDGFLKILNMQSEEKVAVTSIYINLRMKIMTVAWHPIEENIIAYGSDEGRVGIVDFSKRKNLYSFETHHSNSVYSLQWGPCSKIKDSKQVYFLYSCGGGKVFIHELHNPKVKAVAFETLINLPAGLEIDHNSYSELCWKSDYNCLALGTFQGSVYLYNDKFDFLCQLSLQLKNLENLKWHPVHTYSSYSEESKYSSWLAAAGNDEIIHIFDTSDVLNRQIEANICKSTKTLVGHKKRVSSLCWSSHSDGHLISGARDGSVQVWNVITATPIVNYMWHKDIVYSVQWSVLDPDVIYSGGMDNCLRIWRISEQNQSEIPAKLHVVRHKQLKVKRKSSPEEKIASGIHNSSANGSLESNTDIIETSEVSGAHFTLESVKSKMKQNKKKVDSHTEGKIGFYSENLYSKEEGFQNVFNLVDFLCDGSVSNAENSKQVAAKITSEELLNLGLFGDQFTALKMLETKAKIEETSGSKDKSACLHVMACNIVELLTDAAEKKELTDFLVSISPSVSYKFWLSICEKYAIQLIEEEQFMKSSTYFLLCGKLYDALGLLVEKGRLIDALALAKSRLPESDPFIKSILQKVSAHYRARKQVEKEAACYIALKDPLHAAKIMYCGGDSKYAYASVYICSKFNLQETAGEYAVMCVEKCISQNDWTTFYKVAEMVDSVKIYKVVVRVHEIISSHIKALKKEDGAVGNEIFGVTGSKILIWNGKTVENSNTSLLSYIYDVLRSEGFLSEDKEVLRTIHQAINSMETRKQSEIPSEAHIKVAIYISQVIITSILGDLSSATKYFAKIFPCTYNVVFIPKVICWIFFPLNLYWCSNKNTFLCEAKEVDTGTLSSTLHFQNIFNSVCNKFEYIGNSDPEDFTIYSDITSNLDVTVQRVLTILSKKTTEDSFFLYFSTSYLTELRRLAKKGWKFRCYEKGIVSDTTPKGITYTYDSESKKWLVNSVINSDEKTVSMEDVLKELEQREFQLAKECVKEDASQNVSSIRDIVSHVFSSETDCNSKDELVQCYSFKDVSDFLQRVMIVADTTNSLQSQQSVVKLSPAKNINSQIEECEINKLCLEDEDLHAQCWTDLSLYYVITKSFFSIICRDEYALLYCLQNHLLSLDLKIADLARLQTSVNSNLKLNASNQKEKAKSAKRGTELYSGSKNDNSNSLFEDSKLADTEDDKIVDNENKLDFVVLNIRENNLDNGIKLEGEANLYNESEKIKLENEVNLINDKEFSKGDFGNLVELDTKGGNVSGVIQDSTSDFTDINVKSDSEVNLQSNQDRNLNLTNEQGLDINVCNSLNYEETEDGNISVTMTDKIQHSTNGVNQENLQTQHERISEHIKLLQLKEFWYPDPFVSLTDIREICCDIFHKHPCVLIKVKFHELLHKVDEWCTKYSFTKESEVCEICKKINA